MERLIRIPISKEACDKAKGAVIAKGTVYLVPSHKYDFYGGNGPQQLPVSLEAAQYLRPFVNGLETGTPSVGIDLEALVPEIVSGDQIGLTAEKLEELEKGLMQLITIPQKLLENQPFLKMLGRELSEKDKLKLEFKKFNSEEEYLNPGSILRADLLLTQSGNVLSCDPNLVPLGYAIVADLSHEIEKETGNNVSPKEEYLKGIAEMISERPQNISGIITSLNYPNWSSHASLAERVREETGLPFFMIPDFCLRRNGTVDLGELNQFNMAFGIQGVGEVQNVPGVIIRYAREAQDFHPETKVVNAPGIRMLETQLWSGFLFLPGFEEIAKKAGVSEEDLKSAQKATVPTLLAHSDGEALQIATGIVESDDGIDLVWENAQDSIFLGTLWTNQVNNFTEKAKETCWYLKTPSTSGKKGVKFTGDGRLDQAVKNIAKTADKMDLIDGIFLIQPKIRSTIIDGQGEEQRIKIDLFFHPSSQTTVFVDYMAVPMEQRAAQGGSSTRLGLVSI